MNALKDELEDAMLKIEKLEASNATLKEDLKAAREQLRKSEKGETVGSEANPRKLETVPSEPSTPLQSTPRTSESESPALKDKRSLKGTMKKIFGGKDKEGIQESGEGEDPEVEVYYHAFCFISSLNVLILIFVFILIASPS